MNELHIAARVALAVLVSAASLAADVKVEQEQALMPAAQVPATARKIPLAARLSPDGKRIVYATADGAVVLRDLAGGEETKLPLGEVPQGFGQVFTRFNFFSPDGGRLALLQTTETAAAASRPATMRPVIYDVTTKQTTPVPIDGDMPLGQFLPDGKGMIYSTTPRGGDRTTRVWRVDLATMERTPLSPPGWVQSVSPRGDLATVYAAEERRRPAPSTMAASQPSGPPERRMRFLLWDVRQDKQVAELPTHPRNGALDDVQAVWSADGRFVAYVDQAEEGADSRWPITRVWDTQANKEAGVVRDAQALGAGPGESQIVLTSLGDGQAKILLFDGSTGQTETVSESGKQLVHAMGERALYLSDKDGTPTLFVARLTKE